MNLLMLGSRGPQVALLQLALTRAGYGPLLLDGIFGAATERALRRFQGANGLRADGIAGPRAHSALRPYYLGYRLHTIRAGDTLYQLSVRYGTTVRALETANPGLDPLTLTIGTRLTIPLGFSVVSAEIPWFSEYTGFCVQGLAARYPALTAVSQAGESVMGKPLWVLTLGQGENRVLYNAVHHANEWITAPLLLRFAEALLSAAASEGLLFGQSAAQLLNRSTILLVPTVNPDGIDLVTGALTGGAYYDEAVRLAGNYPQIPFPDGWKANIRGTDLNLQYPTGWTRARAIKFAQGFTRPGPRDYVGMRPLEAPESRAMFDLTLEFDPALTLSYHTQGEVIYWRFLSYEPENSRAIAARFSEASGYAVEETPLVSGYAGYKDWFIQEYDRPGYTIEAGRGVSPLPLSQFPALYADNLGILVLGALVTSAGFDL